MKKIITKTLLAILLTASCLLSTTSYAQYTKLLDFAASSNGSYPNGDLISDGTFLYGMTHSGGVNSLGTVFKIMPDGTGYVKLLDFDSSNGSYPYGSLISDGTFLYGMTSNGGTNGLGTIFKIMPDGTGYVKLLDFAGSSNGSYPNGSLISDGTFLYGTTSEGGENDMGTVFKIMPDGTGYIKLLDFDSSNGSHPYASLISDGIFLYGMTFVGGVNNLGTIFKLMPDGTGYVKLLDFDGSSTGSYPNGSLISDGTFLYGMTGYGGGTIGQGIIFKIKISDNTFTNLHDFDGTNGKNPYASLISDGTFLYGMTYSGGVNDMGTVFKLIPDGTGYVKLLDFAGVTNGKNPLGSLISDGTFLYGMTNQGGVNNRGVIFKFDYCSTASTDVIAACDSYTWIDGNTYTSNNNSATHTLLNAAGCDSVVTLNLTINNSTGTDVIAACNSYTWIDGNTYTSDNNSATHTLTNAAGCDSVVTLNLTINNSTGTDIITACNSYTWIDGNTYTSDNNSATHTLTNAAGCDSVVTLNLTINNSTGTDIITACDSYMWIDGNTYTSDNNSATHTLLNAAGCDSVVTLNLTINSVDVSVTESSGSLTANATGATYKWLDCNNNFAEISSETNQTFTPTASGDYAVEITQNNCADTSLCYNLDVSGIMENTANNWILVYPNPSSGIFTIENSTGNISYIITDISGKLITNGMLTGKQTSIDLSNVQSGIYILKMDTKTVRLVRQ